MTTKPENYIQVHVGSTIQVWWSNGAGYSLYLVEDTIENGHKFLPIGDYEMNENGRYELILVETE